MQSDSYSRREFLIRTGRYSSLALTALLFGFDLAARDRNVERTTALVYATRYGATMETAGWIRSGLQAPVDLLDIEHISFSDVLRGYDRFIVGSGIWSGAVHSKVSEFFQAGREQLDGKLLATFIVCGSEENTAAGKAHIESYFNAMHAPLATRPPISKALGGRLVIERLSDADRNALSEFYLRNLHDQLRGWDRTDPAKARLFGVDISHTIDHPSLQ